MAKFNGKVTLASFKKAAVQVFVYHSPEDQEWQQAIEQARSWKRVREVLPFYHPMRAIACGEEV